MIGLGVGIDYSLFIVTRFRENRPTRRRGPDRDDRRDGHGGARGAVRRAPRSSSRCWACSLLGVSFLDGLAVASAIAVLFTMLAALTALPALLSRVGGRVGRRRRPRGGATARTVSATAASGRAGRGSSAATRGRRRSPAWRSCSSSRHPRCRCEWASATPATTRPARRRARPTTCSPRASAGVQRPAPDRRRSCPGRTTRRRSTSIAAALRGDARTSPRCRRRSVSPGGRTAVFQAFPRSAPQASATTDLVRTLARHGPPARSRAAAARPSWWAGATAGSIDFTHVLSDKLPLFIAVVVGLAALLLLVVFRSLVIPVQAALMNLLSIGAALGVTVAVFQYGWLGEPGRRRQGPDRVLAAGDAVRDRLRALDGLRGLPRLAHPRGVDQAPRPLAGGRRRPRHDRSRDHCRGDDHDLRLPRVRAPARAPGQDVRPQPRDRRLPRRLRRSAA